MDARVGRVFMDGAGVGIAVDGGGGADDADVFAAARRTAPASITSSTGTGESPHYLRGHRGHGVAGDDQQLDLLFEQKLAIWVV